MKAFLCTFLLIFCQLGFAGELQYQEINDQCDLKLLNPDLAGRKTAKLILSNGLQAYLISDPNADQSAASIAVAVGSWEDLEAYPGTAHLLEHMLFMGSEKYPNENEYWRYILDGSGQTNAFTDVDRTAYFFSINNELFEGALDRFSRFFIDPLLPASGLSRELHAVDQEFAKNVENDEWRMYQILKEIGNPQHPNRKFSTGNTSTLSTMPQAVLKKWYEEHYSSDNMHLVIYSNRDLKDLKTLAVEKFSAVPRREVKSTVIDKPLSSAQQKGHYVYIDPVKNMRRITLRWELPQEFTADDTKTANLIAYAIQRGQKRSLIEKLKREGLAEELVMEVENIGGDSHLCFNINVYLTERGLQNREQVITNCFETIAGLKMTGVPAYLFHEMQSVTTLSYEHQPRQEAFQFIMHHGSHIMDEDLATYPKKTLLATEYDSKKVHNFLRQLTPQNCQYYVLAKSSETQVEAQKKEQWLGGEYAIRKLPDTFATNLASVYPNTDIKLADPNPFLPSRLEIIEHDVSQSTPVKILDDKMGKVFYAPCEEFKEPKIVYHLHILSPLLNQTPRSKVLGDFYLRHLKETLDPVLKCASAAGIHGGFDIDERNRLSIHVSGFSDKANVFLEEVLKHLSENPVTEDKFKVYYDSLSRYYSNGRKDMPFMQALDSTKSLLIRNHVTKAAKAEELPNITFEDFQSFQSNLMKENYYEVLLAGNIDLKQAESTWMDIHHLLHKKAYLPHLHPPKHVLSLPQDGGPYMIHDSTEAQGNAAFLIIDQGAYTFEKNAAQSILSAALSEAFFSELRTKQKTAYIAKSFALEKERHLYQIFSVQSSTHQPDDLIHRFELFLEGFLQEMPFELTGERFESIREAQIAKLEQAERNLAVKASYLDQFAFAYNEDFEWIEKEIDGLKELTFEEFLSFTKGTLSRMNKKRLALLLEGTLPQNNRFIYEIVAPTDLLERNSYERIGIAEQQEQTIEEI